MGERLVHARVDGRQILLGPKRRDDHARRPRGRRRRLRHVDLHPQEVPHRAVAAALEQVAGGPVHVQHGVLDDDTRQGEGLQALLGPRLREPYERRADTPPEPVGVHVSIGEEGALAVVLDCRIADDPARILDDPGVALRVGERPPVVRHVLLRPVAGARERAVEGLADGHDGSEVRALRRADGERHVSAAGASAASTASTSAGTSIVATAGTTASIVFKPSPVM